MKWLKEDHSYLQTVDFVAFDTETTGLWAPAHRIVEIGAVRFRLGQPGCAEFQKLVNPERPIPAETIDIHGITDSMVRDADTVAEALDEFLSFCGENTVLIAHNALFDIAFLATEFDRLRRQAPTYQILDTVDLFRRYYPGLDSYSLLSLARQFNIARNQTHRAADDATLVWQLFLKVSQRFPYIGDESTFRRSFNRYSLDQKQAENRELPEKFEPLRNAIDRKLRVEITYRSQGRPARVRVIRPNRTYWHKSQYYIAAYCEEAEDERMFRLDRIEQYRVIS